jgi:hypothetical protein
LRRHGDFPELSVAQNESRGSRIGFAQLAFDAQVADQAQDRFRALETLRARFKEKPIVLNSPDQSSGPVIRFEQRHRSAQLVQAQGAG